MATYQEHMQKLIDMREQLLDPEAENPSPESVYEAVQALHATRGTAAAKKKAGTVKPIADLNAIFGK